MLRDAAKLFSFLQLIEQKRRPAGLVNGHVNDVLKRLQACSLKLRS